MKRKIVADSSANLLTLDGIDFQSCPLVIRTNEREFVDDENLDVAEMADYLKSYNVMRLGDIAFEGNKSKYFAHSLLRMGQPQQV